MIKDKLFRITTRVLRTAVAVFLANAALPNTANGETAATHPVAAAHSESVPTPETVNDREFRQMREVLMSSQRAVADARRAMRATARAEDAQRREQAIATFNQRMAEVKSQTQALTQKYASRRSEIAEIVGDSLILEPNAYADAAREYYLSLVAGQGSEKIGAKLAVAFQMMSNNAQFAERGSQSLRQRFLLPTDQDEITSADLDSWRSIAGELEKASDPRTILQSESADVKRALRILADSLVSGPSPVQQLGAPAIAPPGPGGASLTTRPVGFIDRKALLDKALDGLAKLEELPNSQKEIEESILALRSFRKQLKETDTRIPNWDRIAAGCKSVEEA